jgi:hypothetical protein
MGGVAQVPRFLNGHFGQVPRDLLVRQGPERYGASEDLITSEDGSAIHMAFFVLIRGYEG